MRIRRKDSHKINSTLNHTIMQTEKLARAYKAKANLCL